MSPTETPQRTPIEFVTLHVALELRLPKFRAALWQVGNLAPLMGMPKAAMDEEGFLPGWEDDVRLTWQIFPVNLVPVA